MPTTGTLDKFVQDNFGVTVDDLFEALKLSPNALGYLGGAVTELLLSRDLRKKEYELKRIREKWEGEKLQAHHGDFYIKGKGSPDWYVLESKGVKSNSEEWHKLYNKESLVDFLTKNVHQTPFKDKKEIEAYIETELPFFKTKFKDDIYSFSVSKNQKKTSKKTQKSIAIAAMSKLSQQDINDRIQERLSYVMEKIRVLETHLVAGRGKGREIATPVKGEFGILSVDLFLRVGRHKFLFADPQRLVSSEGHPKHLKQNYIMGIFFKGYELKIAPPWTSDFGSIFSTLKIPINPKDMQIDNRAGS